MTKADLHRKYADALDLCAKHMIGMVYAVKIDGNIFEGWPKFNLPPSSYAFPIAVVEDKAVFVGDTLYWTSNRQSVIVVEGMNLTSEHLTFELPPKPKTFVLNKVEYPLPARKAGELPLCSLVISGVAYYFESIGDMRAVRKAIENLLDGKQEQM